MSDMTERILNSVVNITQERNKKSLERVLLSTLADIIGFDFAAIVHRIDGSEMLEPTERYPAHWQPTDFNWIHENTNDLYIRPDSALTRCANEGIWVSHDESHPTRTLIPLKDEHRCKGILVIEGTPISDQDRTLINGFLRIHANFLAVLNESEHDPLTGLLNRKSFDHKMSDLLETTQQPSLLKESTTAERRAINSEHYPWVGVLDIDHFKKINDRYGHLYGDEVLLLFSNLMKSCFRSSDLLFRYGGEEFVAVLSPTSEYDAHLVFERFRTLLNQYVFPQVGQVTASIGIAKINTAGHCSQDVHHADQALYYAKENGRNQIANYHQLVESGKLVPRTHEGDIELF